jgi:preprotein translocase subunit SecB
MSTPDAQQPEVVFTLEKIYLRDVSYEAPGVPQVFLEQQAPRIDIQLGISHRPFDAEQGFHEVVLAVTATARREDKPVFLVEVQQAGVFRIRGLEGEALERTLEVSCPYALLPFLRETVAELVTKGGFPQLLINPINFDALYAQKRQASEPPRRQGGGSSEA